MTSRQRRFGVAVYKEAFRFCSAHFLVFADGSREELHGHNYRVSVEADGPLGPGDMVVDFSTIKPIVRALCDELDHCTLLPGRNPHIRIERLDDAVQVTTRSGVFVFPARDVLVLPIPNTSTERLAEYLCERLRARLAEADPAARVERLRVGVEESSGQCGYYEEREAPAR